MPVTRPTLRATWPSSSAERRTSQRASLHHVKVVASSTPNPCPARVSLARWRKRMLVVGLIGTLMCVVAALAWVALQPE